jgi:hypothetical protein
MTPLTLVILLGLEHTMILAFPYHDPGRVCNDALRRHLDRLQSTFDAICLGATPPTLASNAAFVDTLRALGCRVAENGPETTIGDHSRSALRLAVEHAQLAQPGHAEQAIAFLFLDRFLFAMETEHKEPFLADIQRYQDQACMVFERTPTAWATHPASYREVEGMTSRLGELLFGAHVDWCPCALILDASLARSILPESSNPTYAVWSEWLLLVARQGVPISSREVDWLAWETPFWEQADASAFREALEGSPLDVAKRIHMHAPIALLMAEPRFREILVRRMVIA